MLSTDATLWPMIAHAALVFFLYWLLSKKRYMAVKSGSAEAGQFRENREEPRESLVVHNNLKNQFELPVLFYAVCLALYVSTADNWGSVVLAWIFVLSRYAHSYVHLTSNRLRYRRPIFMVGFFAVMAMWVWLAVWLVLN
ncbi:MAPEG family protein [Neorhizobium galegae]|uniref:Membrane-associated protein in eicosanoid and glutathione metabolism (MAPEG) n=1 Tax=Neorhizobium galegae bv. officinalis TaxID=323656 RepID=A0A0T7GBB3_NEOGA|nr:MAPEG family protein [Neorhizobium galegae]CDZ44552.1 Membrane-associated protein in eicosanoid and glutathione metabolism (MAPEG) [Neorhizobium galegae bv. officinalis]